MRRVLLFMAAIAALLIANGWFFTPKARAIYFDMSGSPPTADALLEDGGRGIPHLKIENYLNLDTFCEDLGFEGNSHYAIGYKQILPWATTVLCLTRAGIYEVAVTHNGERVLHQRVVQSTGRVAFAWADRPTSQIEIARDMLEGCPGGDSPMAILPDWGSTSGLYAEITRGNLVCVDEDIVVYDLQGEEQLRFESFTPYYGGSF